ncbi:MAG: DUF1080 domain-containing protein [Prolixibacteraceae bacterium]|jgi:hypothetical protein|nr:DUF1080 domain-containing protein [Prolixibacteraceae bacterium]
MKKIFAVLIFAFLSGYAVQMQGQGAINTLTKKEFKQGWKLLFDGLNPSQWRSANKTDFPAKGWQIKEGCMVSGGGGNLVSKEEYGNFELSWDWKMIDTGGNSGVKYFVKEAKNDALGIEYQMLDDTGHPWMKDGRMHLNDFHTVGAIYELYPTAANKVTKPVGEWNTSRILCLGKHIEHWLNGIKVAECERGSVDYNARIASSKFKDIPNFGVHEKGLILLQDHGSVVWFRNIKIRKM